MSLPKTRVFVQKDGVVLHDHPGAKGLHGPWIKHEDKSLHAKIKADVTKDLTPEQLAQYKEALGGKSFAFMWENRKKEVGTWAEVNRGLKPGSSKRGTVKLTLDEELEELKAMDARVLGEADVAEEAAFLA